MRAPTKDCSCSDCVSACETVPGWFAPGEAEKAAALLDLPFEQFKRVFLIKDHCSSAWASNAPYVWSPRKLSDDPNAEIRTHERQRERSACVFLINGKCSIHAAKPHECRVILGCDYKDGVRDYLETSWIEAGSPLGMRDDLSDE